MGLQAVFPIRKGRVKEAVIDTYRHEQLPEVCLGIQCQFAGRLCSEEGRLPTVAGHLK